MCFLVSSLLGHFVNNLIKDIDKEQGMCLILDLILGGPNRYTKGCFKRFHGVHRPHSTCSSYQGSRRVWFVTVVLMPCTGFEIPKLRTIEQKHTFTCTLVENA